MTDKEIWVIFAGVLDSNIARGLNEVLVRAQDAKIEQIHFLIQSPGGNVGEGIYFYNVLRNFPIPVTTYNSGFVGSAGVLAYLGGKRRVTEPTASFMIHRPTSANGHVGDAVYMRSLAASLDIDAARASKVIEIEVLLSDAQIATAKVADLTLTAADAVTARIAHEIGSFVPNGPILRI